MELKNLYDSSVRHEIISRINNLTATSQPLWGKMNVSQMLAHVQMPIGNAQGIYKAPRTLFGKIIGRFAKSISYNNKPYKRNLPTDKSFNMSGQEKDFETEKQNLVGLLNNFKEDNIVNPVHPFFGKLTKQQWSVSMYKHLDHHLQQFGV